MKDKQSKYNIWDSINSRSTYFTHLFPSLGHLTLAHYFATPKCFPSFRTRLGLADPLLALWPTLPHLDDRSVAQQPYRVRAQGGKGAVQVGDTNTHRMCGWHSNTEENRHSTWRRSFIRTLRLARCHRLVAVGTFIFMICSPPVMTFALMSFIATSQSFFFVRY